MSAEDTARIKASKEIEKALDEQFKIDFLSCFLEKLREGAAGLHQSV
jgi:hypothetical protein